MKKVFLAGGLMVTTALGGCAGMTPQDLIAQVSGYEAQVQADANLVCGFIPTVATIVALIPGVGAVAPEASAVANAICTAIASAPKPSAALASLKSGTPVSVGALHVVGLDGHDYGKVVINGTFTR